ncbi:MAG: hypothetical protein WCE80_06185 [Acidimicrobiia bacterium]
MGRYSLQGQVKQGLVVGTLIAACTAAVLVAIYVVTRATGTHFSDLTRDAAATLDGPWYTAALSNATVVMTSAGAAIAIFSAGLLDGRARGSVKGFLIALGLLVGVIAMDDLFMLHETVLPALGIRAILLFGVYALALLGILWFWREAIFGSSDYVFLVLAGLALGISGVVDSVFTDEGLLDLPFSGELIEDPAKILGMVFMTFYLVVTARQALLRRVDATTN